MTWVGQLQPTAVSLPYEVLLNYQLHYDPIVYIVSPALERFEGRDIPHVYDHNTLCLFINDQWTPAKVIADTLIPWACEWLCFYEIWLATGEWEGAGMHPNGSELNRRGRRLRYPRGQQRQARLECGLKLVYGPRGQREYLGNAVA